VAGPRTATATERFLAPLRTGFYPRVVTLHRPPDDRDRARSIGEVAPFTSTLDALDGEATAYLCYDHACDLPRTDPREFLDALEQV